MASFQRPNRLFLLVIFCLSTVLAACSSGGGGKGGPAPGTGDTRPDNFTITTPSGVDPTKVAFNAPIVSAPVTIAGIDTAAPVSISGGQFSIDGGTFTSTASTVRNGQRITVRVQSPVKAGQTVTATLNVGGFAAPFTVTTQADTTPPEVTILFPPPASMTEGATLFVRGTVRDVHGTLKATGAVLVNGVAATLERNGAGDEATWSVTLPLEMGENDIVVIAEDASSNINDDESVNSRRVASIAGESFPDNENPFGASINADIGWEDDKPVAYVADDTAKKVFKVDLTTGARAVLSDNEGVADALKFEEPWGIHLGVNGKLYVSDFTRGIIFEVDREAGERTVTATSNAESFWDSPTGMLLRVEQGREKLYVADQRGKIFWIDVATGEQTLIVNSRDGLQPGGEQFQSVFAVGYLNSEGSVVAGATGGMFSIESNEQQHPFFSTGIQSVSALVESPLDDEVYFVTYSDNRVSILNTKAKESLVVAGGTINGVENSIVSIWGIAIHQSLGYLLMVDRQNGLIAMDHESNKRVVISKSIPVAP